MKIAWSCILCEIVFGLGFGHGGMPEFGTPPHGDPPRQTCLSLCRRAAGGPDARDEMSRGLHVKSAEGGFLNVRGLRCVRFHIKSGIKIGYNDTWLRKLT